MSKLLETVRNFCQSFLDFFTVFIRYETEVYTLKQTKTFVINLRGKTFEFTKNLVQTMAVPDLRTCSKFVEDILNEKI